MRILIALTYYRPHYSGLTIHAEREALALAARGHQVTILTSRFDPALPAREVKDGIEIVRPKVWFHISKGVIMPSMPWWAWKLIRDADVVHLHVPQFDAALLAIISRLQGKPVVLTYHCDLLLPAGFTHAIANQVSNLANRITAGLANVIVHNTRDYAENSIFLRRYLDRLYPILPPVENNIFTTQELNTYQAAFREKYAVQPGQRLIGMAARLATEKGVEYLAEALPLVLQKFPQARVLFVGPYQNVVGEEEYANRLAPLIASLGEHWTFLGIVSPPEMAAFYHECEVTVLPSINSTESYGLVQVESILCGTPVIASDLPGVRVPVGMSGSGLIVPTRNAQALAEAIITVLENPTAYQGQPQDLIKRSSSVHVALEYERAFELAIAAKKKSNRQKTGVLSTGAKDSARQSPTSAGSLTVTGKQLNDHLNPYDRNQANQEVGGSKSGRDENATATQPTSGETEIPQTAIILAGGLGTRLQEAIGERPKVLAEAAGRPFLDYLLTYLVEQGIQRVILSLGYQAQMVRDYVEKGHPWGLKIEFVEEKTRLGTGGALRYASRLLEKEDNQAPFFVFNGDTLFMISLADLWQFHQSFQSKSAIPPATSYPVATLALREIPLETGEINQRGIVLLSSEGRIISFEEKSLPASIQSTKILTNGGIYIFSPQGLNGIPVDQPLSLEREIFPVLVSQNRLAGMVANGYFIDIGVPENLARFEDDVIKGRLKWSKEPTTRII